MPLSKERAKGFAAHEATLRMSVVGEFQPSQVQQGNVGVGPKWTFALLLQCGKIPPTEFIRNNARMTGPGPATDQTEVPAIAEIPALNGRNGVRHLLQLPPY